MPTIKASTLEELRQEFVLWARQQAANYRIDARKAKHKTLMREFLIKAAVYEFIDKHWQKVEIE